MRRPPIPANEPARLDALLSCQILDTPAEACFDELTAMAAQICETPIALVSLIDSERQWFKSKVGLCVAETDRDSAFCAYAIHSDEPFIITDAALDDRTRENPLVTGAPFIRSYVGIPLLDPNGFALGTLCVLDTKPRELKPAQIESLKLLARQVVAQLELRRTVMSQQQLQKASEGSRYHVGTATVLTLAVGLMISALAGFQSFRSTKEMAQQRFDRLNQHVLDEIARRVNVPVYGLKGARGVYAASVSVERHEFEAYVESRNLPMEFPGVLGFGFIEHVQRSDLNRFIENERADDAPDFSVRPFPGTTGNLDDMYVVKHIFPLGRNHVVWGIDAGTEPIRRAAIERAVQTGEPTITAPVALPQSTADRRAFIYLVPVYRNGTHPATAAERVADLTGVLFAPILVDDALAGITQNNDGMLDFEVFDGLALSDANRLLGFASSEKDRAAKVDARLQNTSQIEIGGRVWSIRTIATNRFIAGTNRGLPWIVGGVGASLSLLLSAVVWSISRSRSRAFALANRMTADLSAAKDLAVRNAKDLKASTDMLRRTGELARVGGWELNLATGAVTWSDEVYRIHELPFGTPLTVERCLKFYPPDAAVLVGAAMNRAKIDCTPWDLELPFITATGRHIYVRAQGECIHVDGTPSRLCGAFQDITERKVAEEQLRKTATHDKLTGLPNRALLLERLQQCLNRTASQAGQMFAVLFMDFDRFKLTNDTLGHEAGDELLKQIAGRLRACIRPREGNATQATGPTVGRLGGDEFVVILDDLSDVDGAIAIAGELLTTLAAPYRILGHEVVSTASIGIVTSDAHYGQPDEMLRDADIAMYEAKLAGKGRYIIFDAAMYQRVQRRMQTETDLRVAIENDQLLLHYQPIIALNTGEYAGVEALLRWNHPTRGLVSPEELISIAEETGLIIPIGEWVLRTACKQFSTWQQSLGTRAPASISVNVSRKQLAMRDLPDTVAAILAETGVNPACVHLEVTESAVMKDPAAATRLLKQLHAIGVKVDMDDFGTGHSSLAMLHEFPIDVLKIDKSFVKNLDSGREFAAIVQAIGQLARNLGIAVIAEGIENRDQLALLQSLDCDLGQGYFFSRPLTTEGLEALLMTPGHRIFAAGDDTAAAIHAA